jgi:hypothetical protein
MKLLRHIFSIVCIVAASIANAGEQLTAKAKDTVNPPTAVDLQLLQGTWEGVVVDDKGTSKNPDFQKTSERKPHEIDLGVLSTGVSGSPRESHEKISITIKGNSLHFHRDTNFWFETVITLPAGTDPKQLHATIKSCPPSQADSIGKLVGAIFKIEDGTLTLAAYDMSDEPPKTFASAESRYVLKKVQPPKKDAEPPKTQ